MKKRILLIDPSLTVQKVVALTLDKAKFQVAYAKSRAEAVQSMTDSAPDLILISDQVPDLPAATFPKEVESWMPRGHKAPPVLLITGQEPKEAKHFAAVLKKPFSPQVLQTLVQEHARNSESLPAAPSPSSRPTGGGISDEGEERMQKVFDDAFADESKLARETLHHVAENDEPTLVNVPIPGKHSHSTHAQPPASGIQEIWDGPQAKPQRSGPPGAGENPAEIWGKQAVPSHPPSPSHAHTPAPSARPTAEVPVVLTSEDSHAYKATLEAQVREELSRHHLEEVVEGILQKMLPPILEKMLEQKLTALLESQEQYLEIKP